MNEYCVRLSAGGPTASKRIPGVTVLRTVTQIFFTAPDDKTARAYAKETGGRLHRRKPEQKSP